MIQPTQEELQASGTFRYYCPLNKYCHAWDHVRNRSGCLFYAEDVVSWGKSGLCCMADEIVIANLVKL